MRIKLCAKTLTDIPHVIASLLIGLFYTDYRLTAGTMYTGQPGK